MIDYLHRYLSKSLISAYKLLGLAVLTAILAGLGSYLSLQLYFLVGRGWAAPLRISPTDEPVLRFRAQLAQESATRDRLKAEHADVRGRIAEAERTLRAEEAFILGVSQTLELDLEAHERELSALRSLTTQQASRQAEVHAATGAFSKLVRERKDKLLASHVMGMDEFLGEGHQIAQITGTELGVEQRDSELRLRVRTLEREASGLRDARLGGDARVGYDALRLLHDAARARADIAKAKTQIAALAEAAADLGRSVVQYEQLLAAHRATPFAQAAEQPLVVAFVPYENASNAAPGARVVGCRLRIVWCRVVGHVTGTFPGEVEGKHPVTARALRGVYARVDLNDTAAAELPLLHLGRAPLFR